MHDIAKIGFQNIFFVLIGVGVNIPVDIGNFKQQEK